MRKVTQKCQTSGGSFEDQFYGWSCRNCILVVQKNNLKNILYLNRFLDFKREFYGCICPSCILHVHRNILRETVVKHFLFLKYYRNVDQKKQLVFSKLHFSCPEEQFEKNPNRIQNSRNFVGF